MASPYPRNAGGPQVLAGSLTSTRRFPLCKEIQVLRRIEQRKIRREKGIVIPQSAPRNGAVVDDSVVRLHGYAALRQVFPTVPKQQVLQALMASDAAPVAQRPALAARFLVGSGAIRPVALPQRAEPPVMLNLLRTATSGPTFCRTVSTTTVPAATKVVALQDAPAAPAPPPAGAAAKPPLLSRCTSINEDGVARGSAVPELRPWLEELGLVDRFDDAARWVEEMGACDIGEVVEHLELLADALALDEGARARAKDGAEAAAVRAQSRMRPPVTAAPAPTAVQLVQLPRATTTPAAFLPLPRAASVPVRAVRVPAPPPRPPPQGSDAALLVRTCFAESGPVEFDDEAPPKVWGQLQQAFERKKDQELHEKSYARFYRRPYADPLALRARVPVEAELKAVEIAEAAAKEAAEAQWQGEEVEKEQRQKQEKEPEKPDVLSSVSTMREAFMREHGDKIRNELGPAAKLVPAQTSAKVEERFLKTAQQTGVLPSFGYHGTKQHNIPRILEKGLVVPGHHGVKVANGSAHGVGIYTAVPGAVNLSRSFCDSPDMLVVGVVTATPPAASEAAGSTTSIQRYLGGHRNHHRPAAAAAATGAPAKTMGRFGVTRDDHIIREVGSARVIFDERYVAPLFVAKGGGKRNLVSAQATAPAIAGVPARLTQDGTLNTHVANRAGAGQVLIKGTGEKVFLPPEAQTRNRHCINVKRVLSKKERDRERKKASDEKHEMLSLGTGGHE